MNILINQLIYTLYVILIVAITIDIYMKTNNTKEIKTFIIKNGEKLEYQNDKYDIGLILNKQHFDSLKHFIKINDKVVFNNTCKTFLHVFKKNKLEIFNYVSDKNLELEYILFYNTNINNIYDDIDRLSN